MKIENEIRTGCAGNRAEIFSGGDSSAIFYSGNIPVLKVGRVRIDGFPESQGLPEKLRRHSANDNLSVEADSVNVIPFGCEYHVSRHWKSAGNIFELTGDISADNGGRICNLELEELIFPVKNARVEYLIYGEKDFRSGIDYTGSEMIVMLRVTAPEGAAVEFYAGDDFWRHRAAVAIPDAVSEHKLSISAEEVRYTRQIFSLPDEIVPEKRPWRFKSMIAVSSAGEEMITDGEKWEVTECFASGAVNREFRNFIRKLPAGSSAVISGKMPVFCENGAHCSRPGRNIAHGDLAAVFNAWVWASGMMAKRSGCCVMHCGSELFANSVIAGLMAKKLSPTFLED